MMKLKYLFTRREIETQVFYDIVFEWENILVRTLGLRMSYFDEEMSLLGWGGKILNISILRKIIRRSMFVRWLFAPHAVGLKFDMSPVIDARYNRNTYCRG